MTKLFTIRILMPLLFLIPAVSGFGQVNISSAGTPVTQDFNTLAQSGTANTWADNTTIAGWYSNRVVYIGDEGTSATVDYIVMAQLLQVTGQLVDYHLVPAISHFWCLD